MKAVEVHVYRATEAQIDEAYKIVQEYYQAARVIAREDREAFAHSYFGDGAGVWLAEIGGQGIGCVALRKLIQPAHAAEIKRMYVREGFRGQGIADLLYETLERYARQCGYDWLYLDTAAEMKAAARFYFRKGFVECDRYNENPQAALYMRKAIR
jgi:GNAT superfamily N-acetyltransferase